MMIRSNEVSISNLFTLENILLLTYLCMRLNPDFQSDSIIYSAVPVLMAFVLSFKLWAKREISVMKVYSSDYVRWIVVFTAFSFTSFIWSIEPAWSLVNFLGINLITMIPLALYISNENRIKNVLKIFILATMITSMYMFLFTDVSMMSIEGADRLGSEDGWNSNGIGMMCSAAAVFCLYLHSESKYTRGFYTLCTVLCIGIVLLTGSRSALFRVIMCWLFYKIFGRSRGKILHFFLALFVGVVALCLVMNIPFLYSTVGVRIENLLSFVTGSKTGAVDSSTIIRAAMMEYGIGWFLENPILGYGIDNFRYLWSGVAGYETYAHSNYVDLLVGVGIVGTIIYYSFHVKQILVLYNGLKERRKLCAAFFAILCTFIILDIITVTYNSRFSQIILCLVYCAGFVAANKDTAIQRQII